MSQKWVDISFQQDKLFIGNGREKREKEGLSNAKEEKIKLIKVTVFKETKEKIYVGMILFLKKTN